MRGLLTRQTGRHIEGRQTGVTLLSQLREYALLMRLDRPIGTLLLLWPAVWALWLAGDGHPDPWVFAVFVMGVFLMRSAGCVINDVADRHIDPHVRRTRERPLAARRVSTQEALLLFAGLSLIAFGLVLTMNWLTVKLALVGALVTVSYPFFKRFTSLPQFYMGLAFAWPVPMAFAAQTGTLPKLAWLVMFVVILWAAAYDTMYAMVDRDDDVKIGVKSTAILFGDADRLAIGAMQGMVLLGLFLAGRMAELGLWHYLGLGAAALLALYQQYLIRERRPEDCFRAFLNNHYFGMVVFIGMMLDYTFQPVPTPAG